jgi:hypothetical protein
MNIYAKPGTKVRYLAKNGYEGERKFANTILSEGQILTVAETDVGGWRTTVYFEEYPRCGFNSVMFEEV